MSSDSYITSDQDFTSTIGFGKQPNRTHSHVKIPLGGNTNPKSCGYDTLRRHRAVYQSEGALMLGARRWDVCDDAVQAGATACRGCIGLECDGCIYREL